MVIDQRAAKLGDATVVNRDRLSWKQLAGLANRYAWWARVQGVTAGERVCLLMLAIWLGISRVGHLEYDSYSLLRE
jgi:hypothetical protein